MNVSAAAQLTKERKKEFLLVIVVREETADLRVRESNAVKQKVVKSMKREKVAVIAVTLNKLLSRLTASVGRGYHVLPRQEATCTSRTVERQALELLKHLKDQEVATAVLERLKKMKDKFLKSTDVLVALVSTVAPKETKSLVDKRVAAYRPEKERMLNVVVNAAQENNRRSQ